MPQLHLSRRVLFVFACFSLWVYASQAAHAAEHSARDYLKKNAEWFATDEAKQIATNILSWQTDLGGWPKNLDTTVPRDKSKNPDKDHKPTFDNNATTDELRFLARMFQTTKDAKYQTAFAKGYDHILKAQYQTGGWPQSYPPDKSYHRHITFNDNAMVRLLEFLRESYTSTDFVVLDDARKKTANDAFNNGIQCILKCQIKVKDKLTAWCAQHDELDYSPRPGRAYELVSISGSESVGITRLLMSLDKPSPEIVSAVEGAVTWFESAKLQGIRVETFDDPKSKKKDRRVVDDPKAPPLWARFSEIDTNEPIFCDRDGIAKHKLSEIGSERRNGYNWLNYWPQTLLENDYPKWKGR